MANVGLVLSGGMAKGAYQVGVLKALNQFLSKEHIEVLSSSSIGSLNGYGYLTDALDTTEHLWRDLDIPTKKDLIKRLVDPEYSHSIIDRLTSKTPINTAFYTSCYNVNESKLHHINLKGQPAKLVNQYLKASITLPRFSKPHPIKDTYYFDGAFINNVPVELLAPYDLDYIIVIYFGQTSIDFPSHQQDDKIIKVNFTDNAFLKNSLSFDQDSIKYMIDTGYTSSYQLFDLIFKEGPDALAYIYPIIGEIQTLGKKREYIPSADTIVNHMNKLFASSSTPYFDKLKAKFYCP